MAASSERSRRGINSVEVGGELLLALVHHGGPMALKDLAREAGMPAAKAHPYLVSFGRLGLVEQDPATGSYFLGRLALQLGMISLQQASPVHVATPLIAQLALEVGHTVALAVWGNRGPTIVRVEASPAPLHVTMRHGTVFSLAGTASGRLFAAYRDAGEMKAMLDEERRRSAAQPAVGAAPGVFPSWREFEAELAEVRERGLGRAEGDVVRGVNAVAAPVFDHAGQMALAIVAVGPEGTFDVSWEGELARAVKRCADEASRKLGAAGR